MELLVRGAAELGIQLSSEQQALFRVYYAELTEWNTRMNLTAITGWEDVQRKHFLDSLTPVLAFPGGGFDRSVSSAIDIGSGGGFPGLPLKIAFPRIRMVLVESTQKKARFLDHVTRVMGLDSVEVVPARAEELAHRRGYREHFDLVVARALSAMPALVEVTVPFSRKGGVMVALKKGDVTGEVASASRIIAAVGGRLRGLVDVDIDGLRDDRRLVIVDKVAPTPADYPRRTGLPTAKPILG